MFLFVNIVGVLNRSLADVFTAWVPHAYIEVHQLKSRNAAVEVVSNQPIGRSLCLLIDWSEKLHLEPNNSATGATYPKVGL